MSAVSDQRATLITTLFPTGVPRLWCPLLTHYKEDGTIDTDRISAHIADMRPWVSAFLAPGSTGDGWEMEEKETTLLLDFLTAEAVRQDFSLMAGVLRTQPGTVVPAIHSFLQRFTNGQHDAATLASKRICGFTVTPPKGAQLGESTICDELVAIAETGAPIAIYQLPQITENEMSPETVEHLVQTYPNVYLMKDTSGEDHVVLAEKNLENLFLVRGAEGDYATWIKTNGGYYDGFLLSTANSFSAELGTMIDLLLKGKVDDAVALSERITAVVTAVFAEAGKLSFGNPFANANKAIDHHRAWGRSALSHAPPMTHSGNRLPKELIKLAGAQLKDHDFEIGAGYLDG